MNTLTYATKVGYYTKPSECIAHLYDPGKEITISSTLKILERDLSYVEYDLSKLYHRDRELLKMYSSLLSESIFKDLFYFKSDYAVHRFSLSSPVNRSIVACSLLRAVEDQPTLVESVLNNVVASPSFSLTIIQTLLHQRNHAVFNPIGSLAGFIRSDEDISLFYQIMVANNAIFLEPENIYEFPQTLVKESFPSYLPEDIEKSILLEKNIPSIIPFLTDGIWKGEKYE